jgi:LPS O-antigen subunit length determinant protein (WzzB/FepE family)
MDKANEYAEFERTIEQLKRKAREEYERKVQALDDALAMAEQFGLRPQPTEAKPPTPPNAEPPKTKAQNSNSIPRPFVLKDEVRQAIKEFRGQAFVQRQVTDAITAKYPDTTVYPGSVSAALTKLVSSGDIELVKQARGGSDPALYREAAVSP